MRPCYNIQPMRIRSLSLRQFRTYNRLELDLPAGPILLLGANAQGKTSLLEAIAFLAIGASPLTNVDQQIIHWGAEEASLPFSHVRAEVVRSDRAETLELAIERKPLSKGHQRMQKSIRIDQRPVRRSDLAGHLNVVLFLPEDLELVHGPPVGRRAYLDNLLSQVYPTYVEVYAAYRQAVSRRNALLRHLRRRGGGSDAISSSGGAHGSVRRNRLALPAEGHPRTHRAHRPAAPRADRRTSLAQTPI